MNHGHRPATQDSLSSELQRWSEMAKAQERMLLELIQEKHSLAERVQALELDNWTMRKTLETVRVEALKQEAKERDLIKQLDAAKGEVMSVKYESPLAICLIDGDGAIFSREYLMQGEAGGRKAAERLSSGVMDYIRTSTQHIPTGIKIWTIVFLSKAGLEQTLNRFDICPAETFQLFLSGFNAAHGLFSVVDVGRNKEAADYKIRDHLDILIRIPQVYKIFFAGSHDNGYVHVLSSMQTVGYMDKLVILRSYTNVARQIGSLNIPVYEIPDLFLKEKLDFAKMYKQQRQGDASPIKVSRRLDSTSSLPPVNKLTTKGVAKESQTLLRKIDPKLPLNKQNPPPCNAFYLGTNGCSFLDCGYAHDYDLTTDEIYEMRKMAAHTPCRSINNNEDCHQKDCYLGHYCPQGPNCSFYKRGSCKFKGAHMHDRDAAIRNAK